MVSKNRDYIDNLSWQKIIVEAEVTERQTGRTENSSSSVQFFDTPMTLRFVDEVAPKNFKPGLPYIVYVSERVSISTFTIVTAIIRGIIIVIISKTSSVIIVVVLLLVLLVLLFLLHIIMIMI